MHEIAILRVPNSYSLTASDGVHFLDVVGYDTTLTKGVTQTLSGLTIGARYRFSADVGIANNPAAFAVRPAEDRSRSWCAWGHRSARRSLTTRR